MARDGRFRVFATFWVVGLALLVSAGGYNFVSGSQQVPASPRGWGAPDDAIETDLELATFMGHLQHHTHKLNLSLQAQNPELARFYLHEAEEILEQVEMLFPMYDDFPVASMLKAFALPPLGALAEAVHQENWPDALLRYQELVSACNHCHEATSHPFIRIVVSSTNPFNQSFDR